MLTSVEHSQMSNKVPFPLAFLSYSKSKLRIALTDKDSLEKQSPKTIIFSITLPKYIEDYQSGLEQNMFKSSSNTNLLPLRLNTTSPFQIERHFAEQRSPKTEVTVLTHPSTKIQITGFFWDIVRVRSIIFQNPEDVFRIL